ncbi:MAG: RICIN domain-containing protein [Saprospiraceae bacterium]|nr:RICIN domain-containing protein [Saprospiraceae bacterium]
MRTLYKKIRPTTKPALLLIVLTMLAGASLEAQINTAGYCGHYEDVLIPDPAPAPFLILTAVGGDGGKIQRNNTYKGGCGAMVRAIFYVGTGQGQLAPGGTLRFMVGGQGDSEHDMSNADEVGAGGGGGTGIAYRSPAGKWTLLLVAAGGGGGNWEGLSKVFEGGPGRAYDKNFIGDGGPSGFNLTGNTDFSGGGAFYPKPGQPSDMISAAGWPGGPDSGEPTGGSGHDGGRAYYYSGGWGFGAGGIGQRGNRETGGGGGYTGGEAGGKCNDQGCYRYSTDHRFNNGNYMPANGGFSYVNEENMQVLKVLSFERGFAQDPQNGYATYEYRVPPRVYDFIQFDNVREKCITDYAGWTKDGNNVEIGDCVDADALRWYLNEGSNIQLVKDAGQCIDLDHSNTTNGTNIHTWSCNGTNAQKWYYDGISKQIHSAVDMNKCFDLVNGHTANGTNIQLWTCNPNNSNQKWYFERATLAQPSETGNRIYWAQYPDKCIDVYGAHTDNGTNIQLYHCHDHPAQYFYLEGNTIRLNKDRTKCLDLRQSNTNNGANIQLYDCNGTNAQNWTYDGYTRSFRSWVNSSKCIDISNGGTADGTNIQLWDCQLSNHSQQFIIGN